MEANVGYGRLGTKEQWAVWNDEAFGSGTTVMQATKVFLFRYLNKVESLFPLELPKIVGHMTVTLRNDGNAVVNIKFYEEEEPEDGQP